MMQAGTEPTSPARKRFPLSAIIMAALWATIELVVAIGFAWSKGWPILGTALQIVAIPVGALPMYHVMARIVTAHDMTRAGQPPKPQAMGRLVLGYAMGTMVVAIAIVQFHLLNVGLGFATGIMLGLFWWMVRQRSAPAGK
jgi:hypothetical protein